MIPDPQLFDNDKYVCRRLLYVACTRAQGLLYLTHAERRNVAGRTVHTARSYFVESVFIKNSVWLIIILCFNI